jgi:hypothetical protein
MSSSGYNGALQGVIPWFDPIPADQGHHDHRPGIPLVTDQGTQVTTGQGPNHWATTSRQFFQEMENMAGMDRVGNQSHRRQAREGLTSDDTKAAEGAVMRQGREREWIDRHRRTQVLRGAV